MEPKAEFIGGRHMIAVDTNVLVAFLVDRDREQTAQALRLLSQHRVHVPVTAVLELAWVLKAKSTGWSRATIADAIGQLFDQPSIVFAERASLVRALDLYRAGFDFADAVHLLLADRAQVAGFATFDRDFARRANMDFPGLKVAAPQDFAA